MNDITFREATNNDIPFLVNTIIEAEKSGTDILSYSTIFGITEEETGKYIGEMLSEEIDGCELSVSSFLIAVQNGKTAGALSAWIEGSEGVSSSILKANLLKYILPEHCFAYMLRINPIIQELNIEYIINTIQLGAGYVPSEFRGQGILKSLISEITSRRSGNGKNISEVYSQIYSTNIPSIKSAEKEGFNLVMVKESDNMEIIKYLPSNKKLLMKKVLSFKN